MGSRLNVATAAESKAREALWHAASEWSRHSFNCGHAICAKNQVRIVAESNAADDAIDAFGAALKRYVRAIRSSVREATR